MIEKEIGYRVSKLIVFLIKNIIVKEQRVDGSWQGVMSNSGLRSTLMGCVSGYQVKILFNNTTNKIRLFSSITGLHLSEYKLQQIKSNLSPRFVTGFIDGERSFVNSIIRDNPLVLN